VSGRHWLFAEKRKPLPPLEKRHRPFRKKVHLACFLVFLLLPLTDLMRIDIPRQRFYFAGSELYVSEFSIIFFSMMFLMFLVAGMAILYGRIYCGYMCPQMIFSEWSQGVERWAERSVRALLPKAGQRLRVWAGRYLFYAVLGAASVFLAFVFTSYFVAPRDLLHRLLALDVRTAGGITGASVTFFTFLDFTLVRQKFCTTICPYGYLQGLLQDRHSLLVAYQDPEGACIDCRKCVRCCEMGIDIRKGAFQMECIHCGDCVDACEDVLRRFGHGGLIHYSWGGAAPMDRREPLHRRMGFRDAKRFAILLVLGAYLGALAFVLGNRQPVQVRIAPDRTTMFQRLPDGRYGNRVRVDLANHSDHPARAEVRVEGLPGIEVQLAPNPILLAPGESAERTFSLAATAAQAPQELNPIRVVEATGNRKPEVSEMNFIMPYKRDRP
jgi:polyferredoxin